MDATERHMNSTAAAGSSLQLAARIRQYRNALDANDPIAVDVSAYAQRRNMTLSEAALEFIQCQEFFTF